MEGNELIYIIALGYISGRFSFWVLKLIAINAFPETYRSLARESEAKHL